MHISKQHTCICITKSEYLLCKHISHIVSKNALGFFLPTYKHEQCGYFDAGFALIDILGILHDIYIHT